MPEGPTIILMKEDIVQFIGKKVKTESGSAVSDEHTAKGQILRDILTFGKQTFLVFDDFIIKIHLMMFGSYSLEKRTDIDTLRLGLTFSDGGMFFYTCTVKYDSQDFLKNISWDSDIMSDHWNPEKAIEKLKKEPQVLICDALLDQKIFTGVGNIIKNEALFRAGIHPEKKIEEISAKKLDELLEAVRSYSFDFKKWRKEGILKKNFQVYHQKKCKKCGHQITEKVTGKTKRNSFFCPFHQK
jgi:endonuclease-8